jgi:molecular chaperone GrpE
MVIDSLARKPSSASMTTKPPPSSDKLDGQEKQHDSNGAPPPEDGASSKAPGSTSAEAPPADPLLEARAEAGRLKEQWMRVAADFDNFRKRTRRDIEDARKAGREELLKDLLPVFDNLERAIHSASRAHDVKGVAEGLSMVMKQFVDVLGRTGISKVPTTGTAFDPTVHEAIQQVETDEHPVGTVVAEVQPGYVNGERLVRAAMVVVAKPKSSESSEKSQ